MPPRHISSQSFDDILSELGDDPAIPDPHGIRKTTSPPRVDAPPKATTPTPSFSSKSFVLNGSNFSLFWILGAGLLLCLAGLFFYFDSTKSGAELEISSLQSQLLALKEELEFSQSEWVIEREDLYESLDKLEVSINSLKIKVPIEIPQSKPAAIAHEAEIRSWRYLGITRMGASEHAFFHTGKATLMVRKEGLALGEWRLTQATKEVSTLSHPKGKSITFKSTQSE
jgi:hypothetical protein